MNGTRRSCANLSALTCWQVQAQQEVLAVGALDVLCGTLSQAGGLHVARFDHATVGGVKFGKRRLGEGGEAGGRGLIDERLDPGPVADRCPHHRREGLGADPPTILTRVGLVQNLAIGCKAMPARICSAWRGVAGATWRRRTTPSVDPAMRLWRLRRQRASRRRHTTGPPPRSRMVPFPSTKLGRAW